MSKRRNVGPTGVGDILKQMKVTTGLGEQLEQAQIWDHWEKIAGKEFAKYGLPKGIRDRTLIIEVNSSVWMHKYAYKRLSIIKNINRLARRELISEVFIQLAPEDEGA